MISTAIHGLERHDLHFILRILKLPSKHEPTLSMGGNSCTSGPESAVGFSGLAVLSQEFDRLHESNYKGQ